MNLGIYVHIPFCVSKCEYCNFYSITRLDLINDYVLSLVKEIKRESKKYAEFNVDTIFIGGGTPSVVPAGAISSIVGTIKKCFNVEDDCEITIEANPNSITYQNATEWFNCGINRVSVGLQSTSDKLLKKVGRAHTFNDFLVAIDNLKRVGFKNINADIMLGLPTQKQGDVKNTLRHCFRSGITHLSAYTLILEEDTPLYKKVESKILKPVKEQRVLGMFNYVLKHTKLSGFNRYEVSNFALDGYECKHNLNCWNMCNYVGFGCSAHSFVNNVRFSNVSCVESYISKISNSKSVVEDRERVDKTNLIEETIMLGLRTVKGLNLQSLIEKFDYDLLKNKKSQIENLKQLGFLSVENGFIKVTEKGFYVLNKIILELV